MMPGMDTEYASVCINYIKEWVDAYRVQSLGFTQELMEYIVLKGGNGIRDLEESFRLLVKSAKEEKISKIDIAFVDKVLS